MQPDVVKYNQGKGNTTKERRKKMKAVIKRYGLMGYIICINGACHLSYQTKEQTEKRARNCGATEIEWRV